MRYDLVEFLAKLTATVDFAGAESELFCQVVNANLEIHNAAYRIVDRRIVPISSEVEIATIEDALDTEHSSVAQHLSTALNMLSDREQPDYRNSIKESISAVESLAKHLSGKRNASVKDALDSIGAETHPALRGAFNKLYGWTSDANGIRHAMLEDSTVDQADALFMLVACSAFVSYLTAKSAKEA